MQISGLTDPTEIRFFVEVTIDGADRTANFGPGWTATHDADAAFASASLPIEIPFTLSAGRHRLMIRAAWTRRADLTPCFVGEITNRTDQYYPHGATLTAGGFLRRLDVGLDVDVAFCNDAMAEADLPTGFAEIVHVDTDASLIVNLVERYGITPATTGHFIEASDWVPAVLTPIVWDTGKSGWSIVQEIDKVTDWRTSDGRLGQVLRRQVFGTVPAGVRHTFRQGVDILPGTTTSVAYEVWNQVKVTGAADHSLDESDPEHAIVIGIAPVGDPVPSSYIPSPPGVRTDDALSSDYIETFDDAQAIAERRLARLKEPTQEITLVTFGCPDLDIDDGVGIVAPSLGINANAFVVAHTIGGEPFQSTLRLRASVADTGTRPNQPPLPQMLISVILEHVLIDGAPQPLAMITVDARASSDSDGTIASWSIAIEAAMYTGSDIATAYITHATLSASPVDVTLTVVDDLGLSASLTQAAVWDEATALIEPLVAAEAVDGAASNDGEATWLTFAATVTAVAPIALGGTILFGCASGELYRSLDMLATAPTLVATLPAAVSCIWNNEIATTRHLIGLENGDLWLSIDDGLTFAKLHTFDDPINDLSESPAAPGEMTVCSGHSLWHTYDNAATFEALVTGGGTALRFAAGHVDGTDRALVGFDDGGVLSTTGDSFSLPTPAAITGMTLSLDAMTLLICTDSIKTWRWTPAGGVVTGPDVGTPCNRVIRGGAGDWAYGAFNGSVGKIIRDQFYDIRLMIPPQRALAVGYGSVHAPVIPPVPVGPIEVYLPTFGAAVSGVWHLVPGVPWAKIGTSTLPAGIYWRWIAADPANANTLVMLGNTADWAGYRVTSHVLGMWDDASISPIWISTNGGVTWESATVAVPTDVTSMDRIYQVEFSRATPGKWNVTGWWDRGSGLVRTVLLTGTLTAAGVGWLDEDYGIDAEHQTAGEDEDVIVSHAEGTVTQGVEYLAGGAMFGIPTTLDPVIDPNPEPQRPTLDLLPGGRALIAVEGYRGSTLGRGWYTPDYRSANLKMIDTMRWAASSGASQGWVAAAISGVYVTGGNDGGIWKLTAFVESPYAWTPTATEALAGIEGGAYIRSDRQSKTVVAANAPAGLVADTGPHPLALFDGTAWGVIAGPETTDPLSPRFEVVTRVVTP